MQLDGLRIPARVRNPWQAIDLGWVVAREGWWPLFLAWCIPAAIVFAALLALIPAAQWWLASLLFWWLKPLWDCAPLYIASRRLFGERVTLRQAWKAAARAFARDALAWLTWRRLSPLRSFALPVTVLEQLRGAARAQRSAILRQHHANAASWLTVVCAHLEVIIGSGLIGFMLWMLPDDAPFSLRNMLYAENYVVQLITYGCFFFGAALVAPFYVAAGFSLYINRRIELEGWDIEIRFRHIANVARAKRHPLAAAMVMAIALGSAALPAPGIAAVSAPVAASKTSPQFEASPQHKASPQSQAVPQPEASLRPEQAQARQQIRQILDGPDFKSQITEKRWRLKKKTEETRAEKVPAWLIRCVEWLEKTLGFGHRNQSSLIALADILRFAGGALMAAALLYVLYRFRATLRQWLPLPSSAAASRHAIPDMLFGLDVRASSLPGDALAQVAALSAQQRYREALSLLYRAALTRLLHRFALPFRDDMTEGECVALAAARTDAATHRYFAALTAVWQTQAYAHRPPAAATVADLCAQWPQVFGDAR